MAILSGQRLGPYEIVSSIGAGGMGEVYRARDTRLHRTVAIKVLPPHLADSPELRERFEREARTIASLNHPHICTLYDVGHQNGTNFLVMEYLEGETLAHRLEKGSLPLDQTLKYAIEIADALDKAHRRGVTHRDLKPGNIMLTNSETKLLDFGLAKLTQEVVPTNVQLSQLPTANDPLTAQGTIVGTLQYMAPEQLEGRDVDARTDIFAFGAVVYEMATGKKAFEGKSQASLIAAIIEREPPAISSLQPMTPQALDRVVQTCLAKGPDERWQTAGDLCRELKWIAEESAPRRLASSATAATTRLGRRWVAVSALAGSLAVAIVALILWTLKSAPSSLPRPVTRTVITLPPSQRLAALDQSAVVISPDGTNLVYVAAQGDNQQLYMRAMDALEPLPIPGTEGAVNPFYSPDGKWVGFFSKGRLRKTSISGGTPVDVGPAETSTLGASWGSNGTIVFESRAYSGLFQVQAGGGTPQILVPLDSKKGETGQRWPEFLPDGKALLFNSLGGLNRIAIRVMATGERRDLISASSSASYVPSGHLLYAQEGTLMAVPFDLKRLAVTGPPAPVLEGVVQSPNGASQYSFSTNGTLVYAPGSGPANSRTPVWVNRKGNEQPLPMPRGTYYQPRISPDGRRTAWEVAQVGGGADIWVFDIARETLTRLTFQGKGTTPTSIWTPDGKRIAFQSNKEGPQNMFWQPADGTGEAERLNTSEHIQAPSSFFPDGRMLAFVDVDPSTARDIWVMRLSDHKAQPFLRTPADESAPRFSPDGRWVAYVSDESGRREIYVQPYPGTGGKWQISTEGGSEPVWNPSGPELFYRQGNKMMVADFITQPSFSAGKPKVLFEGQYAVSGATLPNYDVTPDGQRFLMLKPSDPAQAATQINVVLNWFEELKQKVPTGKK